MKNCGYLLIACFILFAGCKKDETTYQTAQPEQQEVLVYKDSLPVFKILLSRKANANIAQNKGSETVYLGVSPINTNFDSVRLNIKLLVKEVVVYNRNRTFAAADVVTQNLFDSIPFNNFLSDISIYNLVVTHVSAPIAEKAAGTFTGYVNVTDTTSRFQQFTAILDSLGSIDVQITNDTYTALKATLYKDSFLIGRLFKGTDSVEIDYAKSTLVVSGKKLTMNVSFPYTNDTVISTGTLQFEGVKP